MNKPDTNQFFDTQAPSISQEVDSAITAWRARVMHLLLLVFSVLMLPMILVVSVGRVPQLEPPMLAIVQLCYLSIVIAAFRPRWSLRRRAVLLGSAFILVASIELIGMQLTGTGRITLVAFSLVALLFAGPWAGWAAAMISTVIFGAVALGLHSGVLAGLAAANRVEDTALTWLLQGLRLVIALAGLLILFTSYHNLQRQTLIAERTARRQLEAESAARARLEAEVLRISEEERRRLGAELHDGLCQQLTAALLHCTAMTTRLSARDAPEVPAVRNLGDMIEEAIGMAYDAAKGICPLDMTPDSLASALHRLARTTQQTSGIHCDLKVSGEVGLSSQDAAWHLYRIAQEAVANAVKHSRCRTISIYLAETADGLDLIVRDDGVGSAGDRTSSTGGMGMSVMGYRASVIGGELTVSSPKTGGTIIRCRVPEGRRTES